MLSEERSLLKRLLTLYLIKTEGLIGRYSLCRMTDVPEGIMRGLLSNLRRKNLVVASKGGSRLTGKGTRELERLFKEYSIGGIAEFDPGILRVSKEHVAIHLKSIPRIRSILDLRDFAVRHGARGAVLVLFKEGKLSVPNVYDDLVQVSPSLAKEFFDLFKLRDSDAVIICGSEDKWRALEGGLAVAMFVRAEQ